MKLPVAVAAVNEHTTAMATVLRWINAGVLEVRPDGTIWRLKISTRWGFKPIPPRRADPITTGGYRRVSVLENYAKSNVTAHRLVWSFLHGPIPDNMVVNHLDGDRSNNHPDNLELATCSDNVRHAHKIGSYANRRRRTPTNTEAAIVFYRGFGMSYRQIAKRTGISAAWCRQFLSRHGQAN